MHTLRPAQDMVGLAAFAAFLLSVSLVHGQPARPARPPAPVTQPAASRQPTLIKVTRLDIHGARAVDRRRVAAVLATKKSGRFFWGRKRYFDRRRFDADLERIEAFYRDRGYPSAHVTAFDIDLNDRQDAVALSLTLDEGPPRRVGQLVLDGFDLLGTRGLERLRGDLPFAPGDVLDRAQVTAAQGMAVRAVQDHGHPFTQVAVGEQMADDGLVTLTLTAKPGDVASYGEVKIAGNVGVDDDIVRRTLAFRQGDPFSLATIQVSQRRLYELGLFQVATVALAGERVVDGAIPVQVTVSEAKHRQIRLSAGYGSEERLRGEAEWKHLNFLGGARTGSVRGKWSSLDRGLRSEFSQPYLFSPRLSFHQSAQRWFADEPAYQLDTLGGRSMLTYELTRRNVVSGRGGSSSLSTSFIYEREEFAISTDALNDLTFRNQLIALGLDPRTGAGHGLLGAISIDFTRSTTANVLDNSRGYTLQAHAEQGGGWLPGNYDYREYTLEGRHYQTLGRVGVLAQRAHIGTIAGAGLDEAGVPFFKRYFLGGSTSLRGWGRFEVSSLSASGLPLGGHSMIELSSELRAPVYGKASLVAFVDAGSVAAAAWDVTFTDLRYDVGPGLRYLTPVGPLRVDFAYQLNPIPGLLVDGLPEARRWRVHFSLGQAF